MKIKYWLYLCVSICTHAHMEIFVMKRKKTKEILNFLFQQNFIYLIRKNCSAAPCIKV